jgi:hypothetical protein
MNEELVILIAQGLVLAVLVAAAAIMMVEF